MLDDPHGSFPIQYIRVRDVLRARHALRYLNKFLKNHLFNGPMVQLYRYSLPVICMIGPCAIWIYPHTEVIPDLVTTDLFPPAPISQFVLKNQCGKTNFFKTKLILDTAHYRLW